MNSQLTMMFMISLCQIIQEPKVVSLQKENIANYFESMRHNSMEMVRKTERFAGYVEATVGATPPEWWVRRLDIRQNGPSSGGPNQSEIKEADFMSSSTAKVLLEDEETVTIQIANGIQIVLPAEFLLPKNSPIHCLNCSDEKYICSRYCESTGELIVGLCDAKSELFWSKRFVWPTLRAGESGRIWAGPCFPSSLESVKCIDGKSVVVFVSERGKNRIVTISQDDGEILSSIDLKQYGVP